MLPRRYPPRLLSMIALVLAAILTALYAINIDQPQRNRPVVAQRDAGTGTPAPDRPRNEAPPAERRGWGATVGFASRERWQEHYDKHGAEFGRISAEEYLRRAQALRDAVPGGAILEVVREDGVITRFDRASGAFIAVNRNGIIRTFFRPNDGERYFHRQLERGR
jgi:pyocin large subunit-like protein